MKKIYTLFLIALMGIGSVWAQTYDGGTWYSLLQNHEFNQGSIGTLTKEFDVFPPTASSMSFQWKNKKFWFNGTFGSVDLKFYESTDGSSYGEEQQVVNCGVGTDKTSYQSDSYPILNPSQLLKFKFTLGTSYGAWVSYLKLPLAKHILLKDNTAYGKTTVSKTFTQETRIGESSNIRADFRSFLTAGNISISLTEGDAEVFRLGSADNISGVLTTSTAGNSYAVGANACASANGTAAACANGKLGKIDNYSFQIYFCPKAVGEATGKITITDGTNTATISLKGTGIKMETLEVDVPLSFCQGSSVEYRGKTYTAATSEQINAIGAIRDTVYNVTVTVLQPTTGTAEKTIVYGAEESWNGIDLSEYTVGSHEVEFKTTNVAGCDSTVTLTLTVKKQETLEVPVELSFCAGGSEYYRGVEYSEAGVFDVPAEGATRDTVYKVNVTVLQPSFGDAEMEMTVGDDMEWNGIALKDSTVGVHYVEFVTTNAVGCDSTVTLTLTVNKLETLEVPVDLAFCAGGSEWYRGTEYAEAGAFDVPAEGATRDTLYKVNVTVLQPSSEAVEMEMTVGDDLEWNGIALKDSAVGVHSAVAVLTNAAGCDSTVTLTLTVNKLETLEVPVDLSFCAGGSEWYRGTEYAEAGVFDVPAVGETRDTLYRVNVTVLQPSFGDAEMEITVGDDMEWNGIALKDSTVGVHYVEFVTTNVSGCDSTVTLTLTVNKLETLEVPVDLSFCAGGSEWYREVEYSEAGVFDVPAVGETRDTVYKVNVVVLQPSFGTDEMTIVYGDEVEWNGIALKDSTVGAHSVIAVLTNAAGCDSTVTLTLTVNKMETLEVPVDLSFCAGGSEWYREVEYSEAGVFDVPAVGETRDTVYKVNVVVLQPSLVEEDMTIIVGTDTAWNGIALKDSTVGVHYVEFVTTNVAGCDSTVTLTLTVNKLEMLEVYYPIGFCTGDSAEYRGKWYYEYALDTIYAEGDVRDTIIYVEAMLLPTTDLLVLYDTIVSGNEVILPEGEWVIGEDTVSGTYPTVESEDVSELIFHQYFDEPVVCGPNYIELVVTVTPKEQKPGDTTTDIEDVLDAQKAEKVLIDGVLYIRRGEKVYTASGELVK